jgi:hypothetical protein
MSNNINNGGTIINTMPDSYQQNPQQNFKVQDQNQNIQFAQQGSYFLKQGDINNGLDYYTKAFNGQTSEISPESNSVINDERIVDNLTQDLGIKLPKKENIEDDLEIEEIEPKVENKLQEKHADVNKSKEFISKLKKALLRIKSLKKANKKFNKRSNFKVPSKENKTPNDIIISTNSANSEKEDDDFLDNLVKNSKSSNRLITNKEELNIWIKANKLKLSKVKLSISDMIRKLKLLVTSKIQKGNILLEIEKSAILSKSHPSLEKLCSRVSLISEFEHNYDKICISVYLVSSLSKKEDKSKSFHSFFQYFRDLDYSKFPIFYTDKEMKLMKGTYFSTLVRGRRALFENEFSLLKKNKIISSIDIELKDYMKSRTFFISKNLNIQNKKKENLSVLVPLVDQVVSYDGNKTANVAFSYKNGIFNLNSTRTINEGEELLMKYPEMSNDNSLMYYGFTEKNNPIKNEIYLDIKVTFNSSESKNSTAIHTESVLIDNEMNLNSVLKFFRKVVSGEVHNNDKNKTKEFEVPTDFELESSSMSLLRRSLKAQMDRYPTNHKSDVILMNSKFQKHNITKNEINIARVVIHEKKIILQYYQLVSFYDNLLKNIKNNKAISDNAIRRITMDKVYKNYYNLIKKVIKEKNKAAEVTELEENDSSLYNGKNVTLNNINNKIDNSTLGAKTTTAETTSGAKTVQVAGNQKATTSNTPQVIDVEDDLGEEDDTDEYDE